MARPLRLERAGGFYHVYSRGIERKAIFREDGDREDFLKRLSEFPERFGVGIHAYVLMEKKLENDKALRKQGQSLKQFLNL